MSRLYRLSFFQKPGLYRGNKKHNFSYVQAFTYTTQNDVPTRPNRHSSSSSNPRDFSSPLLRTKATLSGRTRQRQTPLTIDTHTHMYFPSYVKLLEERTSIPKIITDPNTKEYRLVILPNEETENASSSDKTTIGRPFSKDYYDMNQKLRFMNDHDIDISVVSLANPWLDFHLNDNQLNDSAAAADLAMFMNKDLDSECEGINKKEGRTRLLGYGALPTCVNDGTAAVSTLQHLSENCPNLVGVIMACTGIAQTGLDDRNHMDQIYAQLEATNKVLFIHPHYGIRGENLAISEAANQNYGHALELALGFPFETSIAVSKLILSGVLDRFPELNIMVAHGGGTLPWLHGRLDSCAEYEAGNENSCVSKLEKRPSEYLKDLYYDAILYDDGGLERLVQLVGKERVIFGTDHPFFPPLEDDSNEEGSRRVWESCTKIQQSVINQGEDVSNAIFGQNASILFGLTNDVDASCKAPSLETESVSNSFSRNEIPSHGYFADNMEVSSPHDETFSIISPVTNEPIYTVTENTASQVNTILQNSQHTFIHSDWSTNKLLRYNFLMHAASILQSPAVLDKLATLEVQQIGRPYREMRFQLSRLHEWFTYYASLLRTHEDTIPPFGFGNGSNADYINLVSREPLGVVGLMTPWNHPLLITIKKLAPALAGGNVVVLKPSELAPVSVLEFVKMLFEGGEDVGFDVESVPKNVISVIQGGKTVGEALVVNEHVQKIDFTGGPGTFENIGAKAGGNLVKYTSELGGKSPMVVFSPPPSTTDSFLETYIDRVVNNLIFGCFIASGQTCIAGTRVILQHDDETNFHTKLIENLVSKVKKIKVDDPFDVNTDLGPVITQQQLKLMHEQVQKCTSQDVQVLCGGSIMSRDGNYYEPTVLLVPNKDELPDIFHDELFGPILTIATAKTHSEMIALANATPYSLGCSIWSQNLSQAHTAAKEINAGIIWVNDHHKNDPSSPWGGLSKRSGVGRENGLDAFLEYTQSKSVVVSLGGELGLCGNNEWFSSCRKDGGSGVGAKYN